MVHFFSSQPLLAHPESPDIFCSPCPEHLLFLALVLGKGREAWREWRFSFGPKGSGVKCFYPNHLLSGFSSTEFKLCIPNQKGKHISLANWKDQRETPELFSDEISIYVCPYWHPHLSPKCPLWGKNCGRWGRDPISIPKETGEKKER